MALIMPDGRRLISRNWHNATLNVIPSSASAAVECRSCGALREFDLSRALSGRGHLFTVPALENRLKCQDCGAKAATLHIGHFAE